MKRENYYKPTPKKWRKIGDSLLAVSSFIAGYGILGNLQWLAIAGLITGVVGKFLTNMFSEEK
jgi:hypothetical protein